MWYALAGIIIYLSLSKRLDMYMKLSGWVPSPSAPGDKEKTLGGMRGQG